MLLRSLFGLRNWITVNSYLLDTVSEEVRFVCLHNDDIKEFSPVLSHHVCHSFVPAHTTIVLTDCKWSVYWVGVSYCGHGYLHKAERTVGNEEQFLSLANQLMQNSIGLLSSQNKLICKAKRTITHSGTLLSACVQKTSTTVLTKILHDPFVHVAFEMDHANCLLRIKLATVNGLV